MLVGKPTHCFKTNRIKKLIEAIGAGAFNIKQKCALEGNALLYLMNQKWLSQMI